MISEQHGRYATLMRSIISQAEVAIPKGATADEAAQVIVDTIVGKRPRTCCTVGRDAALVTRLARMLPDGVLDRMLAAALRPHFPEERHSSL